MLEDVFVREEAAPVDNPPGNEDRARFQFVHPSEVVLDQDIGVHQIWTLTDDLVINSPLDELGQLVLELEEDGFRLRAAAVLGLPVAGQCNQHGRSSGRRGPDASGDLVTIERRETDVHERHDRADAGGELDGGVAISGLEHLVPVEHDLGAQHLARVLVILHHEDPQRGGHAAGHRRGHAQR